MKNAVHNKMADAAYKLVARLSDEDKKEDKKELKKEFRSLARSFPSMLQVNGLGNAIAFLHSKRKGGNASEKLYEGIQTWTENNLRADLGAVPDVQGKSPQTDLMERITQLDSTTYRIYTDEVMNLCLWIKRFAEGMIVETEEEQTGERSV